MKYILVILLLLFAPPALADDFIDKQEALLVEATAQLAADPDDADAMIWFGRRLGYLGRYEEAIQVYLDGFAKHPNDARFLRHMGHRYITLREFDEAVRVLLQAADMMAGVANKVEPDGLPNAAGIPTSTLKGNIYYHLALSYYLSGNFESAAQAFAGAIAISENFDSAAANRYWLYLSNIRAGNERAAERAIAPVSADWTLIENFEYHRLILCFKDDAACAPLLDAAKNADGIKSGTMLYGLKMKAAFNLDAVRAAELQAQLLSLEQKNSFGYIAAEADASR